MFGTPGPQAPSPNPDRAYEDDLLSQAVAEDPIARFLFNWRKQIALILVLGALGYYWNHSIKQHRMEESKEAADLFAQVRTEWESVEKQRGEIKKLEIELAALSADDKSKHEELQKKVTAAKTEAELATGRMGAKLDALGDDREPYRKLAQFYRAYGLNSNDTQNSAVIEAAQPEKLSKILQSKSSDRFWDELSAYTSAKLLLNIADKESQGKTALKQLAEKGEYLHVAAALTLAKLAASPQERTETVALLNTLKDRFPEQSSALEDEVKRISVQ